MLCLKKKRTETLVEAMPKTLRLYTEDVEYLIRLLPLPLELVLTQQRNLTGTSVARRLRIRLPGLRRRAPHLIHAAHLLKFFDGFVNLF